MCFPELDAYHKLNSSTMLFLLPERHQFVSDGKSDAESDRHPICMQIGQRIGSGMVCVDGP
jgi:hypothetical protein